MIVDRRAMLGVAAALPVSLSSAAVASASEGETCSDGCCDCAAACMACVAKCLDELAAGKLIGGQEDQLIDIALELKRELAAAAAQPGEDGAKTG